MNAHADSYGTGNERLTNTARPDISRSGILYFKRR